MEQKDIEYFRTLLNNMLEEAQHKGDSTLEDLTDSNELFADPADRASAESDRAFTLRIRDRERRLIPARPKPPSSGWTKGPTAPAKTAVKISAFPVSRPVP